MVIRALPNQIPQLWDAIKFASVSVLGMSGSSMQVYLNNLLHSLLSNRSQCFVRMNSDRTLQALMITNISTSKYHDDRVLFIESLYSFERAQADEWSADIEVIKQFAREVGCKKIETMSTHPKIFDILSSVGFSEGHRFYTMEV